MAHVQSLSRFWMSQTSGPLSIHCGNRKKPLLFIDLAVPRDIEPQINQFECVSLFNIDDLNEQISLNKEKRNCEIPKAQTIVEEFTDKFMQWYDSLNIVPAITQLTQKGLDLAHSEANHRPPTRVVV